MADNGFRPKPLVNVTQVTEFGGVEDMEQFKQDGVAQRDYTYVEGFSEMRVKRDTELFEHAQGQRQAKDISTLPVNLRWYRTVKGAGSDPDQMRVAHAKNLGYRAVTKSDVGQPWLLSIPPGGMVAPDGTIKTAAGDNVLMVATREVAARNAMRRKIATEEMVDGMTFASEGLQAVAGRVRGADPTIKREVGEPIQPK